MVPRLKPRAEFDPEAHEVGLTHNDPAIQPPVTSPTRNGPGLVQADRAVIAAGCPLESKYIG